MPSQPRGRQVVSYPVFDRWVEHPGRRLTLARIFASYNTAEEGDPQWQCDIFDDRIEADAHLRSLLETRVDSVARKPWIIQEGGDDPADKEAAKLLEDALRLVPNFIETLEHQLRFNWYGYSGSEIKWEKKDGLIVPTWFVNVPHRRFRFDELDRPRLQVEGNVDGELLRQGSWWFTCRAGRILAASGLMRTATIWSFFKTSSIRDWLVWANRYGIPMVTGTYNQLESQPEEINVLKKAVKALGTDGWAVFSDLCKITITEVQAGGKAEDVHGALCNLCDAQNSKLLAGATLVMEGGSHGSYAQSRVHENRSFDLIAGDAERLGQAFEQAIGVPFVKWNGFKARPPRLKLQIIRDMTPEGRAKIFVTALNELRLPLDEDQVRQELQLKSPAGAALQPPAQPAPNEGQEETDAD